MPSMVKIQNPEALERGEAVPLIDEQGQPISEFYVRLRWTPKKGSADLNFLEVAGVTLGTGFVVSGDPEQMVSPYKPAIHHSPDAKGQARGFVRRKTSGEQIEWATTDLTKVHRNVHALVGVVNSADSSTYHNLRSGLIEIWEGTEEPPLDSNDEEPMLSIMLPINLKVNSIVAFVVRRDAAGGWVLQMLCRKTDLMDIHGDDAVMEVANRYATATPPDTQGEPEGQPTPPRPEPRPSW